ncbi:hypothetical protein [Deminuibacter soli]|uniref:DUF3997 domain-containing protein n=1 Tax=Deminuibacter soli TaxID=2291815 RepID=A0A3E1NHS8_9BACT|nr:hypothetical protein [Deminuibacter soli]RFM27495.1 hypothetical protein DXN05_15910 [Deminuibacter soli]
MLKNRYLLSLLFAFCACNDMWLDKRMQIVDDIYLIQMNGDGIRIGKRKGESDYIPILQSSISALYKNENLLYAKANPETKDADTIYYVITYKELSDSSSVRQVNAQQYDSLRKGLKELILTGKWQ